MKTPLILTVLTWTLISFAIFEGTSASPIPAVGESDFPAGCSCGSSTTTSGTPKSAAASIVGGGEVTEAGGIVGAFNTLYNAIYETISFIYQAAEATWANLGT
ncbi:hypothetical protein Fcan01_14829 [Folsomia candida]|uniref:Uncharacterized protein n=1 Tax=Folsomia candida TaxID=158441 RepID=A0A226DZW6_FOLCA|nr:hypothetical protein Fcan01_14829 [Folsomia candida]